MTKFENYLIGIGIHFQTASKYGRVADKFESWLKENKLSAGKLKQSQYTEWLQFYRESGNKKRTIEAKKTVIKHYYQFLGIKNNPTVEWLKSRKEYTLPPTPLTEKELHHIYCSFKPQSPAEYRNRCMLGLILFQGLKRSELAELRLEDIHFDEGYIYVIGQRKTNSRKLTLESLQIMHLYDYIQKYRKGFTVLKKHASDKVFLSMGESKKIDNSLSIMLRKLKCEFPKIDNFLHIRGSVITNWQKKNGIMEAMVKAGHRYISSTKRYQTNRYEELHEKLVKEHPLEQ